MSDRTENEPSSPHDREPTSSSIWRRAIQIQSTLYRRAKAAIGPRLGAKYSPADAVHEAVVRVVEQTATGKLSPGQQQASPSRRFAFALRDVIRNAVRRVRREGPSIDQNLASQADSSRQGTLEPECIASGFQRVERIDQRDHVLAQLPKQERDILMLREVQGLSFEELADHLQCSVQAATKRYYRAASSLKVILERIEQRDNRRSE